MTSPEIWSWHRSALVRCAPVRTRILTPSVIAIFLIGIGLRLWVLTSPLGTMSADEAYTGLQASAILDGRLPVVIDGMTYTAVAESYLFAPLVAVVGVQVVTLKWLSAPGWLLAAATLAWVTSRLGTRRGGMMAAAMVWLAPGAMLVLSTRAYVGYSTGLLAVTATLAATHAVVVRAGHGPPDIRLSALSGFTGGLACYLHPMFATVAVPMLGVASVIHRRHLRRWWLPATAGALLANSAFIAWNARNGWPSLSQPAEASDTWWERLERFATGLVPRTLGLRTGSGDWILGAPATLALYLVVVLVVIHGARIAWRRDHRAGAVLIAPLVASWPLMALLTNLAFVADGRSDGYAELHMNAWDCLAGLLLVEEAGGRVSALPEDGLGRGGAVLAVVPALATETSAATGIPLAPLSNAQDRARMIA